MAPRSFRELLQSSASIAKVYFFILIFLKNFDNPGCLKPWGLELSQRFQQYLSGTA